MILLGSKISAQVSGDFDRSVNTGASVGTFSLRISPDARSGAMGNTGIAISSDANAQHWNLAKIPFTAKKASLSLSYVPYYFNLSEYMPMMYFSGYLKFGNKTDQSISASFRNFSQGKFEYRNDQGASIGTRTLYERALDLGYSRKISGNLSAGIGFRFIQSATYYTSFTMESKPANAYAADIGLFYTKTREKNSSRSSTLAFGAVISNLGSKLSNSSITHNFIPMNLGLGGAYTYKHDACNQITFALDINKLLLPTPTDTSSTGTPKFDTHYDKNTMSAVFGSFTDAPGGFAEELNEFQISLGIEYWFKKIIALRAGYFYEHANKGGRQFPTAGVGANINIFTFAFSYWMRPLGTQYSPRAPINNLRLSLMIDFGEISRSSK